MNSSFFLRALICCLLPFFAARASASDFLLSSPTLTMTVTPTITTTPTMTITATPTVATTATVSATPTPTITFTVTPTQTTTPTVTVTITPTNTIAGTPTSPTLTLSPTVSITPTSPSFSITPTITLTVEPTITFTTPTPSISPTITLPPSPTATASATATASISPSASPTAAPTTVEVTPSATTVPPTETATPSVSPSASPTPSATQEPTETPTFTPSISISPSITASPSPTTTPTAQLAFTFDAGDEGWIVRKQVGSFNPVDAEYNAATGSLDVITDGNANSFGFWETVTTLTGGIPGDSLIRSTWSVRSDVAARAENPTIRMRASAEDFSQSSVLVVTSAADGALSPGGDVRDYEHFYRVLDGTQPVRLTFDVLNFDPSDTIRSRISLDGVVVESIALPTLTRNPAPEVTLDFAGTGANGFQPSPASSPLLLPEVFAANQGSGLAIAGLREAGSPTGTIFGYWGANLGIPLEGGSLYRVTWKVRSSLSASEVDALPTFRLRMNDSSFRLSALLNVESVGAGRLPSVNSPGQYDLWFRVPAEVSGENLILSFDYLLADPSNDPTAELILQGLAISEYLVP